MPTQYFIRRHRVLHTRYQPPHPEVYGGAVAFTLEQVCNDPPYPRPSPQAPYPGASPTGLSLETREATSNEVAYFIFGYEQKRASSLASENALLLQHSGSGFVNVLCLYSENLLKQNLIGLKLVAVRTDRFFWPR